MSEQNNGQLLSTTQNARPRYTGELLLRTRLKVYRQIVRLLSEGVSANQICKLCHVTRETVRAVERREAAEISTRKKSIIGILSDVAELGASRMEETISKASLRDATIGTGVAIDKICQLTEKGAPSMNIAIISMPTPEERELLNECHRRLRAIAIGESKDPKADIAWLAAYSKMEESKRRQLVERAAR
jgi:DNA invertase Pin-like site-specific DNA recombinase